MRLRGVASSVSSATTLHATTHDRQGIALYFRSILHQPIPLE